MDPAVSEYPVGGLVLVPASGWQGYGIALAELACGKPSRYTHAAILVSPDGGLVEAEPHGARTGHVEDYPHARICDLPVFDAPASLGSRSELRRRVRDNALRHAELRTPYSYLDYLAIAALHWHLPSERIRARVQSSGHMQCAQLVDAIYRESGIHLFWDGRLSGDVTPADLAQWVDEHE